MPIQRLMSDEALLHELGHRIARLRLERNLSQAQLAEQAGISKRTLERLEAGAAATQLSLFLRVLRQLDLLERLELLLPSPHPWPCWISSSKSRASAPAAAASPNRPAPGAGGSHDRCGR
jgi:DNA-binding XRE family transcriptional regulator